MKMVSSQEELSQEESSQEDPRSKRGGYLLFDHSSFPDAVILRFRDQNFTISASYLALHSPYFYDLFYGPNSTEEKASQRFDIDPDVFGDLLDMIYPCLKKTNCCVDCSSSLAKRLDLALSLQLKFAVKRLLKDAYPSEDILSILQKHDAVASYSEILSVCFGNNIVRQIHATDEMTMELDKRHSLDPLPVSTKFPDSTIVCVRGVTFLVSATALSLHSAILCELLYKNGKVTTGVNIDVDPHSFLTFVQAVAGELPTEYTVKFLDDLLFLGAKHYYEYFISEIRMKFIYLPHQEASRCAIQLLEHYCNRPNLDLESMKYVASYLSIGQLEEVLSKCPSLSPSVEDELRLRVNSVHPMILYVKTLTGRTINFTFPRGVHTLVEEVKMRYEEKEGVPADELRLILAGRQMGDGRTLEFYKIQNESTLHAVLRLRGC